jgi:hypothetical protein
VRFVYPGAVRELIARFEPSRGAAAGTSDRQRVTRLPQRTAGPRARDEQSRQQPSKQRSQRRKQPSKQQGKKIV